MSSLMPDHSLLWLRCFFLPERESVRGGAALSEKKAIHEWREARLILFNGGKASSVSESSEEKMFVAEGELN